MEHANVMVKTVLSLIPEKTSGRTYAKEALQKPPLPSRMEQKCSVRLFLTTPECAVFFANTIVEY